MSKLSTQTVDLFYEHNLLVIKFKPRVVIDQKDVLEFVECARELVKRDYFATLIDGREDHFMMQAAQEMLSQTKAPTRLGLAIVTNEPITERRVDNYIDMVKEHQLTRRFNNYDEAEAWLRSLIQEKFNSLSR